MPEINSQTVWERIRAHAGCVFRQLRGREFTYEVRGNVLRPNTTNRNIPKSDFDKAIRLLPIKNTVPLQNLQGPSYIFAILADERIRCKEWLGPGEVL